jgi:RNA polymerase primary sigma factor
MPERRHRLLTVAEEARLSRRAQNGDLRAKDRMIESNIGLVHSVARKYNGLGVPFDDLVQEGTLGLIRAVELFDSSRGLKFSTYAVWWIRRGVMDALAEAQTIRMPAGAARQLAAVERAETELRSLAPGAATVEAIADRTGLRAGSVSTLQGAARVTASLDERIGEDGTTLAELVADPEPADPWRRLDERETRRQAWSMIKLLPKRHRKVVMLRYGLDGGDAEPHSQIASRLGLSEERSRQLEREALHRLRELGGGRRAA